MLASMSRDGDGDRCQHAASAALTLLVVGSFIPLYAFYPRIVSGLSAGHVGNGAGISQVHSVEGGQVGLLPGMFALKLAEPQPLMGTGSALNSRMPYIAPMTPEAVQSPPR